ncbi:putative ribonuclease H-like domain-containing protein [Tanacetum coccineum]|uniref:Ribonuclease H-like domain-containing protein n=1 Tax=Tanacetum coccineum TaxID=301880 RepID=A0ABQ5J302_9ASTR
MDELYMMTVGFQAMQEECFSFKLQQVWVLVDLPHGMKVIGTKWVYRNKRDERGVVVRNKARLVAQGYTQERAWYATLSTFLEKHGYKRGTIDKTLFIRRNKKDIMLVQVYVDDIIFGSTNKSWCDEFEALMQSRFQMSTAQIAHTNAVMGSWGSAVKTSASYDWRKTRPNFNYNSGPFFIRTMNANGPQGRPKPAKAWVTPKTSHLNAVKRIFKYLKGKPHLGLWYPRESPFDLEAFSDSDYGGSNLDRKSTTGGCQFLGQRLISWQCKKQTIVATSTTEAEYVAAANCCGQVLWVQNQLLDYGFNFMNTKIHIDNESTICIVKNPVYHSKTKHIEIRHHFIRDCYEKKLISVEKIHTDLNVADLLTKPFDGPRFNYLVVSIGFAEIVDFLRGSNLRYALTSNPTIYDSLVKQFWQTATTNTKADGTLEINATIDTIGYGGKFEKQDKVFDVSLFSANDFEYSNGKQTPLSGCQEHDAVTQTQPSSSTPPVPSTSSPPPGNGSQTNQADNGECYCEVSQESEEAGRVFEKGRKMVVSELKRKNLRLQGRKSQVDPLDFEYKDWLLFYNKSKCFRGGNKVEDIRVIRKKKSIRERRCLKLDFKKKLILVTKEVNNDEGVNTEERARAKRNKSMTQSQLKTYMMNYLKNQGTWKLSQLKNLNFEEVKEEFDKLVKHSDEAKDVEPTKKSGKRRKHMARKGLHTDLDKDDSEDSDKVSEQEDSVSGTKIPINPVPVAMKIYLRDDLTELYRIVMNRYGMDGPEDELEKYPLSAEVCKAMLDKKLQGGKPDENCYKMLKMIEKKAGIRK